MIAFLAHHPVAVMIMLFASPTVLVVGVIAVELFIGRQHEVEMSKQATLLDDLEEMWNRRSPA